MGWRRLTRLLACLALATFVSAGRAAAAAQPPAEVRHDLLNVVVIEGFDAGRPFWLQFQSSFRDEIARLRNEPVAMYVEGIDSVRFPRVGYLEDFEQWLRQKYRGRRVDAVVASSSVPLDRLLKWRQDIWSDAPLVIVLAGPRTSERLAGNARIAPITWVADAPATIALARELFPQTRRVFFVGGNRYGDAAGEGFRTTLQRAGTLQVMEPKSDTLSGLEQEIASLPADAVVLYSGVYQDAVATGYTARDVLDVLAPRSNRPIFGMSRTYLGHGIVGGMLLDPQAYARAAAAALDKMLSHPSAQLAPAAPGDGQALVVDYRELERWSVAQRRVPATATVAFKPPTLWQQYHRQVTLAGVLIALQSLLVVVLLFERRRRRHAEQGMRQLSGRLIRGQEEERRRIASELHDDVNQRIAFLAIGLDRLAGADPQQTMQLRGFADEARALGSEVHALARRLRPPQIDTAGLPTALRDLAERMEQRTGVVVSVLDQGWPQDAPVEGSLVLYRVAQEALQNALKHSGAHMVRITLRGDPQQLTLNVHDDGMGIAPEAVGAPSGLGIAGMRERLGLVGGELQIDGVAGAGTTVRARVPRPLRPPVTSQDVR